MASQGASAHSKAHLEKHMNIVYTFDVENASVNITVY
jgi:hypothetical protein